MEHLTVDSIYKKIMRLSSADREILYARIQKEREEIIAYTTSDEPLTKRQYIEKIEQAIAEADRGELITDEELQKEIDTW
jgi:predicted transcriptional regulator